MGIVETKLVKIAFNKIASNQHINYFEAPNGYLTCELFNAKFYSLELSDEDILSDFESPWQWTILTLRITMSL